MAAERFPDKWPEFIIRKFNSLDDAYNKIRDFIRNLAEFRKRILIVGNDHADRLTPETGSGAPGSTPADTLLFYLDTSNSDMYVSVGTSSSGDWKKITP